MLHGRDGLAAGGIGKGVWLVRDVAVTDTVRMVSGLEGRGLMLAGLAPVRVRVSQWLKRHSGSSEGAKWLVCLQRCHAGP